MEITTKTSNGNTVIKIGFFLVFGLLFFGMQVYILCVMDGVSSEIFVDDILIFFFIDLISNFLI